MSFVPPTDKQIEFAVTIQNALRDTVTLAGMDKWQMRDYIAKSLESEENKRKIREYSKMMNGHNYKMKEKDEERNKFRKPWLTDESLGGEWGLDASDFGAQAWGNS